MRHTDLKILTSAVFEIREMLSLADEKLALALDLSVSDLAELYSGEPELRLPSKSFEAAQALLRLHDSLQALFGGCDRSARSWMSTRNLDFDARPIDLIVSPEGLCAVRDYLEGYRARV